jgi:signal peptidase I
MTGSMRPMIHGGEYFFAEKFAGQRVYPGDLVGIVTWYSPVLHEVTAVSRDAVMTSGRANRHSDGWTDKSAILFIVRQIERKK